MFRPLIWVSFFYLVSPSVFGQGLVSSSTFEKCDPRLINEALVDFGENREKFEKFVLSATGFNLQETLLPVPNGRRKNLLEKVYLVCVNDDTKKLYRRDTRLIDTEKEDFEIESLITAIGSKKDYQRFIGSDMEVIGTAESLGLQLGDPWNMSLCSDSTLRKGGPGVLFWSTAFTDRNLVASESSSSMLRGEWKYGKSGKTRVSIYFDRRYGNMPVFVRYHILSDGENAFSDNSTISRNEIRTEWEKTSVGWVPKKIDNQKVDIGADKKPRLLAQLDLEFSFHGTTPERISGVFEPRGLYAGDLWNLLVPPKD